MEDSKSDLSVEARADECGLQRTKLLSSETRKHFQRNLLKKKMEAEVGIEPTNGGFANLCLTTWLLRRRPLPGGISVVGRAARVNPGIFHPSAGHERFP